MQSMAPRIFPFSITWSDEFLFLSSCAPLGRCLNWEAKYMFLSESHDQDEGAQNRAVSLIPMHCTPFLLQGCTGEKCLDFVLMVVVVGCPQPDPAQFSG